MDKKKILPLLVILAGSSYLMKNIFTKSLLRGFDYRKPIVVKYIGDADIRDGYVLINVNTKQLVEEGKLKADCSDLRFEVDDTGREAPYVFFGKCPAESTEVAVYVGDLSPEQTKTIWMYYKAYTNVSLPIYALKRGSAKVADVCTQNTWKPNWYDIDRRNQAEYWRDLGRDALDGFGYPQLCYESSCVWLHVRPGVSKVYKVGPLKVWVRTDLVNPWVWRMIIIPIAPYQDQVVTFSMHGNLGSDGYTRWVSHTITLYDRRYTYYVSNDESNVDEGIGGDPQIRYFLVAGDPRYQDNFEVTFSVDNVRLEYEGTLPITVLFAVGDLGKNCWEEFLKKLFRNAYLPPNVVNPDDVSVKVGIEQKVPKLESLEIVKPRDKEVIYANIGDTLTFNVSVVPAENMSVEIQIYIDGQRYYSGNISSAATIPINYKVEYYGEHVMSIFVQGTLFREVKFYILKDSGMTKYRLEVPPVVGFPGNIKLVAYVNGNVSSIEYRVYDMYDNVIDEGTMTEVSDGIYTAIANIPAAGFYFAEVTAVINNETLKSVTTISVLPLDQLQTIISKVESLERNFTAFYLDYLKFKEDVNGYLQEILNNTYTMLQKEELTYNKLLEAYNLLVTVQTLIQQDTELLNQVNQTLYNELVSTRKYLAQLIEQKINEVLNKVQTLLEKEEATYNELATVKEELDNVRDTVLANYNLLQDINTTIINKIENVRQDLLNVLNKKVEELRAYLDKVYTEVQNISYALYSIYPEKYEELKDIVLKIEETVNATKQTLEEMKPIKNEIEDIKFTLYDLYNKLLKYYLPSINQTIIQKAEELKQKLIKLNITDQRLLQAIDNLKESVATINTTINVEVLGTLEDVSNKLEALQLVLRDINETKSILAGIEERLKMSADKQEIQILKDYILDIYKKLRDVETKVKENYEKLEKLSTTTKKFETAVKETEKVATQSIIPIKGISIPTWVQIIGAAAAVAIIALIFLL